MSKVYNSLMNNGWYPVPYKHHPEHIKKAIKLSHFRPQAKQCFANSQRLVLLQYKHIIRLRYVEGIVQSIIPIQHAWVMDEDDNFYDITLNPAPTPLCYKVYSLEDVQKNVLCGHYKPINENWLNLMQQAVMFGFNLDIPEQEVKDKIKERFSFLNI
jgi:hypothetical protein